MLHAKDLMIGDWVILYGSLTRWGYTDYAKWHNEMERTDIHAVEPVRITPEILEKNFEKKTFYGIYDDYFDLDIREYSDSIYVATFHNCEMNTPDQQMTFSFVHELQHFLSHCGIKKEIVL